jgi:hypothetical protein
MIVQLSVTVCITTSWLNPKLLTTTACRSIYNSAECLSTLCPPSVFWNVTPCSVVDTGRYFRGDYCLHRQGHHFDNTDERFGGTYCLCFQGDGCYDWGNNVLWNVGRYLSGYTVLHSRRQPSSKKQIWSNTVRATANCRILFLAASASSPTANGYTTISMSWMRT